MPLLKTILSPKDHNWQSRVANYRNPRNLPTEVKRMIVGDALQAGLKNGYKTNDTFQIKVTRYCTTVDGTIIDKSLLPSSMQIKYPVYLLGNFDRNAAYSVAQRVVAVPNPNGDAPLFLGTFVYGFSLVPPFLAMSGFNDLKSVLLNGDIVTVYTDSIDAPNYFVWIVQSNDYAAVGSFVQNPIPRMVVNSINYLVDDERQYGESWIVTNVNQMGLYSSDALNVSTYKTVQYKLNDFIEVGLTFEMAQSLGINFLMIFTSDSMQLDFKLSR